MESTLAVTAAYAQSGSMSTSTMSMPAKSKGDPEMMAAMQRMQTRMDAAAMTGDRDHDFMLLMIPHHQSAVEMAKIELKRGKHPQLKALASDIVSSQDSEIAKMKAWLKEWYPGSK